MLPVERSGTGRPALIFMPFTGGSSREYNKIIQRLDGRHECIGLDLPGYGAARDVEGYRLEDVASQAADAISSQQLDQFVLVGHSYSGRIAAILARLAADGDPRLNGLRGLVLIAPSTFSPDPLPDDVRTQLLEMFTPSPENDDCEGDKERKTAEQFILMNVANPIPSDVLASAIEDVLRMNRAAWQSWYAEESRKDWSERIGVLQLPALIVAGEKDPSVGPSVQEKHNLPHFYNGKLEILNTNHLIPLEMPEELAGLIQRFVERF